METDEYHLFETDSDKDANMCASVSVCKKLLKSKCAADAFMCDASKARVMAAESGRNVCGVCVSHLYATQ
ncbi:MAG: hypothetical protein JWP38_3627 [Herbaspirillum sp.]|nr:hypothetical protein [Herbaspirillum sp.]